jgi:hypothetical protein
MNVLSWMNGAVADSFIDSAIEQLELPFAVEGLHPQYTAAAAKTAANAIEWYHFTLVAPLPELEPTPQMAALLAQLRTEPKDWTFDFMDLHRRKTAYQDAVAVLAAARRILNPVR